MGGMKPASFAQKLWRFCIDPRVEESALIEPLHETVRQELATNPGALLAIHDWSTLSFGQHPSKTDRAKLTHDQDVGYDLATVLMVRAEDGAPIAPAVVELTTADGVLSTRNDAPAAERSHLDQIRGKMHYVRGLDFGTTVVHVIDREADSVDHWRQWSADGHLALVRGDDRKVLCQGEETSLETIAERWHDAGTLKDAGPARYHGRPARLFVAEAEVVLHRPGKRNRGKKKIEIPGPPLPLRLVVTEVHDLQGQVLARWLLLSNVPAELADAATLARWYYFRWRIESLHKLLKKAGFQLESWLQRTGERLLIKLLIALAAAASVWGLERRNDTASRAFQALLMELSGRQTKRDRPVTTSGLLSGLWVLVAALGVLARHGPEELNAMLGDHLPLFAFL
ncbi:MAG: transposase [Acetobacteraceae bacterium]|nr:transposase [Acetobacteraceae bacterium]